MLYLFFHQNSFTKKIKPDTQKCDSPSPLSSLFLYPSPSSNAIIYISFLKIWQQSYRFCFTYKFCFILLSRFFSTLSYLFLYPSPPPNAIIYISFLKIWQQSYFKTTEIPNQIYETDSHGSFGQIKFQRLRQFHWRETETIPSDKSSCWGDDMVWWEFFIFSLNLISLLCFFFFLIFFYSIWIFFPWPLSGEFPINLY